MKNILKTKLFIIILAIAGLAFVCTAPSVHAAAQTFTVNSTALTNDANSGDGVCETSNSGECTLTAAISQANSNSNPSDQDIIEFNISGAGPHTITLDTLSLIVTQSVFIDGYSQPGALANTSPYPQPLNGSLMIEIDGSEMTQANGALIIYSSDVKVSGLAINRSRNGQILTGDYDHIQITGNYLGTDPTGLMQLNNPYVNSGAPLITAYTDDITIGGSNPEDRNVITGYSGFGMFGDDEVINNVKIQGNNFYVGSDGVTPLPPLFTDYAIGLSFSNVNGLVIGGDNAGEGNIIENLSGSGISLGVGTTNVVVAGNRVVGNGNFQNDSGINIYQGVSVVRIGGTSQYSRNVISDSGGNGITIGDSSDINILGNYIGVAEDGVTALPNNYAGINLNNATNIRIGSSIANARNVIAGNSQDGITTYGVTDLTIQNNAIGVGQDGITALPNQRGIILEEVTGALIGGTGSNEANIIAKNYSTGVHFNGINNQNVSILSNSIFENGSLGIDFDGNGVTQNDDLDPDTGNNNLLNFPRVFEPVVSGGNTEINYFVDVPAGDYRIEFFSNSSADASGHGEGETFIGYQNITSTGTGKQTFSTSIPGASFTNVFATTTEIVNTGNSTGFGATSEFGDKAQAQTDVSLTKTLNNPQDVAQGGTIEYTLNYKNNGPDSLDMTQFNDLFSGNGLILDLVAPDITPVNLGAPGPFPGTYQLTNTGNSDVTCIWLPHTSAGGFGYTDHADWGVIGCEYTGSSNTVLNSGESFDLDFEFTIAGNSELAFRNYALAFPPTQSEDPDAGVINAEFGSGQDAFTGFTDSTFSANNFASSVLPVDLSIDKTFLSSNPVLPGDTVQYQISITNNGTTGFDLADYNQANGPSKILFTDVYPGNILEYTQNTDPNVACYDAGPGSAVYLGPAGSDHPDYRILSCVFTGPSTILSPGQTFSVTLDFTAQPNAALSPGFKNYVVMTSESGNPDSVIMQNLFATATSDILDTTTNNQAFATEEVQKPRSDFVVGSTLNNPQEFKPGGIVNYTMKVTNNGPTAANLTDFDGNTGANFFYNFIPPELTPQNLGGPGPFPGTTVINGTGNPDLTCIWGGPDSLELIIGPNTHPGYSGVICLYSGSGGTLASGASRSIDLSYLIDANSDLTFKNYILAGIPLIHSSDPDAATATYVFTSGNDIIDQFSSSTYAINNFATILYQPTSGGNNNGSPSTSSTGSLSSTGEDRKRIILLVVITLGVFTATSVVAIRRRVKKS